MEYHDQFENDEVFLRTQNEFLDHMFLMEAGVPELENSGKTFNPDSRSCTCCNGYPDSCSDPTCLGIGMCICAVTESDIEEIGDDGDYGNSDAEEAEPERKQLFISSSFTPFVPTVFSTPPPIVTNATHQFTLSTDEVKKLEKVIEEKKNAIGDALDDLYSAIWKLRLHTYGGDANRNDVLWDPTLEPKLPQQVAVAIVNPYAFDGLRGDVKDQFYSLESKRRWFFSKNQRGEQENVERAIKALAQQHGCAW